MPSYKEALIAISKAQIEEVAVILRQEKAASARGRSLEALAQAFRTAAELARDADQRQRLEVYAGQSDREARAAFMQARVHSAEAKRARTQAQTSRDRAAATEMKPARALTPRRRRRRS